VKVTCGCKKVIEVVDLSQQRLQMAMRCLDIHFTGLNKFKAIMGIPHVKSDTSFRRVQSNLLSKEEGLLYDQIHNNRLEELNHVRSDPNAKFMDEKPMLTVKIDGSWSKAGFTSKFGFVVILSANTGKVLDYEFMSKYCNTCYKARVKHPDVEPEPHQNCKANYKGSSGGMEAAGIKLMFERSMLWQEGGVIYSGVVRDRDSDVMFHIRYLYKDLGLCEQCTRFKNIDAKSTVWKSFVGTINETKWEIEHQQGKDGCYRVNDYFCVEHWCRNLGGRLRNHKFPQIDILAEKKKRMDKLLLSNRKMLPYVVQGAIA
ncbi:unnamed protein product, partial [Meganyctiphanes norvegica]